jgi:phosphoribosylaminoimidazole-succinocarboxamide synthase
MDFHKSRYTPMSRRRRIYEGKAKVLYEGPEPGTLIQHFKDDATAFNAKKHEVIEGKGVLNNRISEYVFQHLNDYSARSGGAQRCRRLLGAAPWHRGGHAIAALDHRVLLQERRAQ